MWRLFSRILLLALLQYPLVTSTTYFEACPAHKVCTLFTNDACKVNGVKTAKALKGYVFKEKDDCYYNYYTEELARLDIEPQSARNWSFELIYTTNAQKIIDIGFNFDLAKLAFPDDSVVEFHWRKSADAEWQKSTHPLKFDGNFWSEDYLFNNYTFNIDSATENLISYIGVTPFALSRYEKDDVVLTDESFVGLLDNLMHCDPADLNEPCHGGVCERIEFANTSDAARCDSKIWYHPTAQAVLTRDWKSADRIECRLGNWAAVWEGGLQVLDPKGFEVQCAAEMPAKWTGLLTGLFVGGGVLFGVALIVIIFFAWRARRNRNFESASKRSTLRSSNSHARTPGGTSSKKKSRFWSSNKETDIEGLHTEKFSGKEKTFANSTPGVHEPPPPPRPDELQEPKGFAAGAGPPLPKGFASQAF